MKKFIFALAATTLLSTPAFAEDGKDVFGLWQVGSGSAVVKIADCGDGTPCGTLYSINTENPEAALDSNNPDPDLATKPLLGSRMLWGFEEKSKRWSSGKIYDAESGKSYKSKIKKLEDGTLEVKGCVGPFCQSQIWTAVEIDQTAADL